MRKQTQRIAALVFGIALIAASAPMAGQLADVQYESNGMQINPVADAQGYVLTVSGQGHFVRHEFGGQGSFFFEPSIEGEPLPDGSYTWELTPIAAEANSAWGGADTGRSNRTVVRLGMPERASLQFGYFTIAAGSFVMESLEDGGNEPAPSGSGGAIAPSGASSNTVVAGAPGDAVGYDQVILDDLIVDGSICAGLDCVNGESFGFDTLRLKENNLRIKAQDTSSSASFPTNDWQITFNESSNGGQNKFSIDDIDGGRTPFTIEAGAPSHSLYVDDGGRIGLGTSTPVVEIHVKDGDTPTVRLEQDGSSGFTPQTWDMAGNETNWFVRDATNGSKLPLRIRPDAPSNSIFVDTDGDIGLGTSAPDEEIHVTRSSGKVGVRLERTGGTAGEWEFANSSTNTFDVSLIGSGGAELQIAADGTVSIGPGSNVVFTLAPNGDLTITGVCEDSSGGGTCADYVFEPGYQLRSLDELATFIEEKQHLPNVPSADEIRNKGFSLQTFQGRLLEKIEELTLYTLEQHELIGDLQERLAAVEKAGE